MAEGCVHQHFIYDLRYNSTHRRDEDVKLNECGNIKGSHRMFQATSHCVYVNIHSGIRKQASQKRTDKWILEVPFGIILPMQPQNLLEVRNTVFERMMIERALSQTVFSSVDLTEMMVNLKIKLTSSTYSPNDVELILMKEKEQINSKCLFVENEIPHTKWLKQYIENKLGTEYVVTSRENNVKYIGTDLDATEITDYAASQADLVIFKNHVGTNPKGCNIIIRENRIGLAAEVKEVDEGDLAVSECFRNMHGTAANLVLQAARQGIVIDSVTVYGIVAIVTEIDRAKLLKLQIDFTVNLNNFFKSVGVYSLDLLLNVVVKQL